MFSRALFIAVLATSAFAAPALAQSIVVPPVRELVDDNNVDLFRGVYVVDETVASLGGSQGMAYRRINRGQSSFTDNLQAVLANDANTYYATFDGRTDRFTKSGSTFTPTEANGSSLTFNSTTNIYTYAARDGTVITFDRSISAFLDPAALQGMATSIVSPNGSRLDYVYQRTLYCAAYDENEQRCLSRVGRGSPPGLGAQRLRLYLQHWLSEQRRAL